jgi:hypothetical protein
MVGTNLALYIVNKTREIMKSLITLVLSLIVSSSAFSFSQECEDTVLGAVKYYKSKMEGITDQGYSYVEYDFEDMKMSSKYNYSGLRVLTAKLALSEYESVPTLINQKYNNEGKLNGIDVLQFKAYWDLVFVIEPMVQEACAGQYEIDDAGEGKFSNIKLFSNNTENQYELENVKIKMLYVREIQVTGNVDNSAKNNNFKGELPADEGSSRVTHSSTITKD